jgi:NAD(P)H-dependent FMN reductase
MLKLQVIIASTRPGRVGKPVGTWFYNLAKDHEAFDVELIDLAEVNLPFLDEPSHPRLQQYTHRHTKDWSARINSGDAYVIVTSEYNFGYPASIKNALDFLYTEWNNKPVAFVSYGGVSGGMRSVQQLKQIVQALQMVAIVEATPIPFVSQYLNDEGEFAPNETIEKSARSLLDPLATWAAHLKQFRGTLQADT